MRAVTPLGRWGGGEQIALAVVSLIQSDFITGECIRIDGGRHIYEDGFDPLSHEGRGTR